MPIGSDLQVLGPTTAATPSQDGTKVQTPGDVIVDNANDQWRISSGKTVEWLPVNSTAWLAAGLSSNVTGIEKWGSTAYYWTPSGDQVVWFAGQKSGMTVVWNSALGDPSVPTPPVPAGAFRFAAGQILGPDGQPFRPVGINLYPSDIARSGSVALLTGFPKLNVVRLANLPGSFASPTDPAIAAWVADLTGAGIAIVVEPHYTGGAATGGQLLTDASNLLTSWATTFKDNVHVWFGTQNEARSPGIQGEMTQLYQAVRSTGCMNPVLLGCGMPGEASFDTNAFVDFINCGFDQHFWPANQASGTTWASILQTLSAYQNRDGAMVVWCGACGDSDDGNARATNWQDTLSQCLTNQNGFCGWYSNHDSAGANLMLQAPYDYSALTDLGTFIRDKM